MQLSADEIEARYHQRIADESRALAAKKYANPDRDYTLEDVWVAYVWTPITKENPAIGEWLLAGFRRKRNLRRAQTMGRFFAKIRRRLGVEKKSPVMLLDLATAVRRIHGVDQSWRVRPPQFQKRKPKIPIVKPPLLTKRGPKIRAKVKAIRFNKTTKFIALGRNIWDRKPGHLYLGPLLSDRKRSAQFEAKRLFPVYADLVVIAVPELSKVLRAALLRNTKVRAGATRIRWPEVPPTFGYAYGKYLDKIKIPDEAQVAHVVEFGERLHQRWTDDGRPWLTIGWFRKVMKSLVTPSKVVWTRWGTFKCVQCGSEADTPSSINHGTVRCVPTPAEDDTWARDAKAHARKLADRKRKRKIRRDEKQKVKERKQARKRSVKKAARTRARNVIRGKALVNSSRKTGSPKLILVNTRAKLKAPSGRSPRDSATKSVHQVSTVLTPIGSRLRIMAIVQNVLRSGRR